MKALLRTDAYKFSMGEAGFPLREETFYLSFRRGGWQYIPFDLEAEVRAMLPSPNASRSDEDNEYLSHAGYSATPAMWRSLREAEIKVHAAPPGSWVYEREPILTITGSSFALSWLEPLLLRLFYPIQLATALKLAAVTGSSVPRSTLACTCDEQAAIARRVWVAVHGTVAGSDSIEVLTDEYRERCKDQATKLVKIVEDPMRIFEVGMRSVTCDEQHRICLEEISKCGIRKTSNVALANDMLMTPVGTMGHEHVQRWGNDLDAYRAMRDMRTSTPTYLLDTFDTITSGIPAVLRVLDEHKHECAIRYDSGDKFGQYVYAHGEFKRRGYEPTHVIEDSLDDAATRQFETLRAICTKLSPEKQVYGYGGYLVHGDWLCPLTRDRVSAVYKLSQTSGEPRMKFGNEAGLGKTSVPGCPVIWRRLRGTGPVSIIGQLSEEVPEDYVRLNGANEDEQQQLRLCRANSPSSENVAHLLSPATKELVAIARTNSRRI